MSYLSSQLTLVIVKVMSSASWQVKLASAYAKEVIRGLNMLQFVPWFYPT